MDSGSIANAASVDALFGGVKLDASAHELCLNYVEMRIQRARARR
jgi:hypothetical protein